MTITNEIFSAYLECKYKAYLLLSGQTGSKNEYAAMLHTLRREFETQAATMLLQQANSRSTPRGKAITPSDLQRNLPLFLECTIVHDPYTFRFDALQRATETSSPHRPNYIPALFSPHEHVHEHQKRLLAYGAYLLGHVQGKLPAVGLIYHGANSRLVSISLEKYRRSTPRTLDRIVDMSATDPPKLVLNNACRECQFEHHCRVRAVEEDNLSLLERLTETNMNQYNRKGIFTVNQLSYTYRPRRRSKRAKTKALPHSFPLQALAIRDQTVYVIHKPALPTSATRVYVDMEGDPMGGCVYLIGANVVRDNEEEMHSFWADTREAEKEVFERFLEMLNGLPNPHVYHYGSYEARVFRRIINSLVPTENATSALQDHVSNVLNQIYSKVYFPTYSNSLKAVAGFLGHEWTVHGATGLKSLVWRWAWERSRDARLKRRLLRYNKEDCLALRYVTTFLDALACVDTSDDQRVIHHTVRFTETIARSKDDGRRYGVMKPALKALDGIVECAYFEHQRNKVYVRTHPHLKVIHRRINKNAGIRYYINKRVEHDAKQCPHCDGRKVTTCKGHGHTKLSVDLVYLTTGIRRRVVKHRAHRHMCRKCNRTFFPRTFTQVDQFGDGLAAWAMYQYVANHMTFDSIALTAHECFGISLPISRCHSFKERLAARYRSTVENLRRTITVGQLIHSDETRIKLKGDSGYVWILTNMEEVVYLYRPTREVDFLKEMLVNFGGTLVTDFYSGYDSMPCRQQKCLVHPIRDLNGDLLKHPFDVELVAIAEGFGTLMQGIVATIDKFGLRSSLLSAHLGVIFSEFTCRGKSVAVVLGR